MDGELGIYIQIVRDGMEFIARAESATNSKEYRNAVFEDMLTEMVIDLQEELGE